MKQFKMLSFMLAVLMLLSSVGAVAAQQIAGTANRSALPYDGVEFTLLTFVGPQVAEPLQRRAPDFEKLTGAKINIATVPNADLYTTLLKDQSTGTNAYQAFLIAPSWMGDFVEGGYLEPLDDYVAKDKALEWDDIAPFFRDFNASYKGHIYMLPLDGDFHMVYYRTDVFEAAGIKPPTTWDEYLTAAKTLNGKDMNGDGAGDYGSCISKKRSAQSYWWVLSIAAPYIQSQGTSQGAFFDPETMKPLVENEGFERALDIYKETGSYGPPNEQTLDVGDTRTLFTSGRCALTLDWGDIGTLAIAEGSKVVDKTGSIITPGSKKVVDWKTGKLVDCDKMTCPLAVDGVNYAPFASFGGWSGAVSAAADPKVKEAAYAFLSYMDQPAQSGPDVTVGKTGYNPYRLSHFKNLKMWTDAGMSEAAAKNYLGAIEASLNSPNMMLDIRVPHNNEYEQIALDAVASSFVAGEFKTSAEAAAELAKQWEALTDKYGRDAQKKAYVDSLSVSR